MTLSVRPARPGEEVALSALCLRSKAHWGYDAAFLRQCVEALAVTPSMVASGAVLVAERAGPVLGLTCAERDPDGGRDAWDLALCFVDPPAMGQGVGRALMEAQCAWLADRGARRLSILADPGAEPFYRRMGAVRLGEAPSDAVPGRVLPLLEMRFDPATV